MVLVKNNRYVDKYVAIKSLSDMKVVSHGKDAQKVIKEAVRGGKSRL